MIILFQWYNHGFDLVLKDSFSEQDLHPLLSNPLSNKSLILEARIE